MILRPATRQQLRDELARAHSSAQPVAGVDLQSLCQVVEYSRADMTITVESGLTVAELQKTLSAHRQWLPVDPPDAARTTINDLLARDLSGPRRFGYGTIREHLLGLTVALADGRVIKNGGKVVKNVAGYDLCKLFVGHQNTLGILIDATFRLRPLPEEEAIVCFPGSTFGDVAERIDQILQLPVSPIILDVHNLEPDAAAWLVVGFAGNSEDVQWQLQQLPPGAKTVPLSVPYHSSFWGSSPPPHRLSVLPSRLASTLETLAESKFVAQAGNGVIHYRGGTAPHPPPVPTKLMRQIKTLFDPKQILPPLPW